MVDQEMYEMHSYGKWFE